MAKPELNSNTKTAEQIPLKKLSKRTITLSRLKRKLLTHVWIVRAILLVFIFALLIGLFLIAKSLFARSVLASYVRLGSDFVFAPIDKVATINGRTNILIMGKSGDGLDSPDLTDTMILVSISYSDHKITSISIPRDTWIAAMRAKINSSYYYGKQKTSGGGLVLSKSNVEEIFGTSVQYAVVIDFSGFKKIIDVLGGIQVDVENSFVDGEFPIPGRESDFCAGDPLYKCRYETIKFEKGREMMDGATALKFVRSRHAVGDEGTDLAREARQQKVILGIIKKVLTPSVLLSPRKLIETINTILGAIETDIPQEAQVILVRKIIESKDNIKTFVIPPDLLLNPPISPTHDNQYVFIPKKGDWTEVQNWVKTVLP